MILNKSDQVDQQQLMRVYGALMWSLGKVFRSPEVRICRHMAPLDIRAAEGFSRRSQPAICSLWISISTMLHTRSLCTIVRCRFAECTSAASMGSGRFDKTSIRIVFPFFRRSRYLLGIDIDAKLAGAE